MALYGKQHVARYRETDGKEGHAWNNTQTLLLTTLVTLERDGAKRV